jgi:integrase
LARTPSDFPVMRWHKGAGQWYYFRNGRNNYLGADRAAAERRHRTDVLAIHDPAPLPTAGGAPLAEVVAIYLQECVDGRMEQRDASRNHWALDEVVKLFGSLPAERFRVREVEQLTRHFCAMRTTQRVKGRPFSADYIRKLLGSVRQCVRWCAMRDLITAETCSKVCMAVRMAKPQAPPAPPTVPVPPDDFRKAMALCSPEVRAMATLQLLSGMRTGELLGISVAEIDRSREVWTYRPANHKNAKRGKSRSIYLDAECQALLAPYLERVPIFGLTLNGYDNHLKRAAKRAGVPQFRAYQFRHARATEAAIESGDEAARLILGHSSKAILSIYTHTAEDERRRRAG